jgi:hypothetical protein
VQGHTTLFLLGMGVIRKKWNLSGKHHVLLFCFFLVFRPIVAQPPQYKMQVYISTWSELAVSQMIEHGIPASVTLAQAIFESRCGGSELAKRSNNHFGIKCHIEWSGDTIVKDDDTLNECFRRYKNIEESYTDHSLFLAKRPRYAFLFGLPSGDYKSWCYGLKEAGYATYETYAEELIRLIEQTGLYKFDEVQVLLPKKPFENLNRPLKTSAFSPKGFDLIHFSQYELLWMEELNAHVRSLDLIVKRRKATKRT